MASTINPLERAVALLPEDTAGVKNLINSWVMNLMSSECIAASASPKKKKNWLRGLHALRILQSLLDQGHQGKMWYHGVAPGGRFRYHMLVGETRCTFVCKWTDRLEVTFVRIDHVPKLEAQGDSSFNPLGLNDAFTPEEITQGTHFECLYRTHPHETLANVVEKVAQLGEVRRLVVAEMEDNPEDCRVISLAAIGLDCTLYLDEEDSDLIERIETEVNAHIPHMHAQLQLELNVNHTIPALQQGERVYQLVHEHMGALAEGVIPALKTTVLTLLSNVLICALNYNRPATLLLGIANIAAILGISASLVTPISEFLIPYFETLSGLHAQAGGFTLVAPVALIGTIFSAYLADKVPCSKDIDGLCSKLSHLGRAIQGGERVYTFIETHFTKIIDECFHWFCGIPRGTIQLDAYLSDVDAWLEEVKALATIEMTDKCVLDVSVCERVDAAFTRGNEYVAMLNKLPGRAPSNVLFAFNHHLRIITKVYDSVLNLGKRIYRTRFNPFVIHLTGPPGRGKTEMIKLLVQDLLVADGLREGGEEVENHIYTRRVEQEFWNGYKGQFATLYDDFGQLKDSVGKPNVEFMELINVANTARYPLNMAELIEKNRVEFTSKVVILTSNIAIPYVESLTCPPAMLRRRDIVVDVGAKPGKFDEGVGHIISEKIIDDDVYEIRLVDKFSSKCHGEAMNYRDFSKLVCSSFCESKSLQGRKQEAYTGRWNELVEQADFVDAREDLHAQAGNRPLVTYDPKLEKSGIKLCGHDGLVAFYDWLREGMKAQIFAPMCNESQLDDYLAGARAAPTGIDFAVFVYEYSGCLPDNFVIYVTKVATQKTSRERLGEIAQLLRDNLASYWKSFLETSYGKKLQLLAAAGAVAVGLFGIYRVARSIASLKSSDDEDEVMEVEGASNDNRTVRSKRMRVEAKSSDTITRKAPRMKTEGIHTQAALDPTQQNLISTVVYRNLYRIIAFSDDGERHICNGLVIKGRLMILPGHILAMLSHAHTISLRNCYLKGGFTFSGEQWSLCHKEHLKDRSGADKDVMIVQLPRAFPSGRSLINQFVLRKDMSNYQSFTASLAAMSIRNGVCTQQTYMHLRCTERSGFKYTGIEGHEVKEYKQRHGYGYTTDTKDGDCGSPLIVANTQLQRKLVGIHVAGGEGFGCAASLSCEDLEAAFLSFPMDAQIDLSIVPVRDECETPNGDFIPIGKVERNYAPVMKTALLPSPLYGRLEPVTTAPSALSGVIYEGQRVDPLGSALKKCGKQPPMVDEDLLRECVNHYASKLLSNAEVGYRKVLTFKEAVSGSDLDFIDPVNRRSSPGYPWVNQKKKNAPGKTTWLGDDEYDYNNEALLDAVRERIRAAKAGRRKPVYWIDTLKDERRPLAKVRAGKTRVFSAGSMDYILVYRMFFLGFNAHVMRNRIYNESAVGINVYSDEWHMLAKYLQECGPKVTAGDFSSFDGSLSAQVLWYFADTANRFYSPTQDVEVLGIRLSPEEQNLVRTVLFEDIVGSIHVFRDNLYQWTHSQTSGGPSTVIINSFYNSIAVRMVWLDVMSSSKYGDLESFDKYVRFISYGDDNVVNISDEVIDLFDMNKIVEAYSRIGLTYTMEDKDSKLIPYRGLGQVDFLKRSFSFDEDRRRYHGRLDMSVIMEMPNWIRTGINVEDSTFENVDAAVRELVLYPQEVYEERKEQLLRAVADSGMRRIPYIRGWKMARVALEDENRGVLIHQ